MEYVDHYITHRT